MRVFNSNSWPTYLDDGRVLPANEWSEVGDVNVPSRDGLIFEDSNQTSDSTNESAEETSEESNNDTPEETSTENKETPAPTSSRRSRSVGTVVETEKSN